MASSNDLLNAICADLKQRFPALKACAPHDGRFDLQELRRIAARTPALYVACLGTVRIENPGTGQSDAVKQLAAYVVTKSTPGLPRGEAARNLVDALEVCLPGARWGLSGIGPAGQVRSENLYSGSIDRHGVALWAVSWRQTLRLGTSLWTNEGTLPTGLYLSYTPDIGADHQDDYEPLEGIGV